MPWYKQPPVWAVVISVTALLLSQLPPIGAWVNRTKIETEISRRVGLPNAIGIPGYQLFMDIKNAGNRTANLSKLRLNLTYPNNTVRKLEAQTYLKIIAGQVVPQEFPMMTISLGPGLNWSEMISFYPSFSPTEDEQINKFRLQISQSILSKQQSQTPGQFMQADPQAVEPAVQFFTNKFDLEKGSYRASIVADVNGMETTLKTFSFTLYDFHITTIRSQVEDYKFGAGVYFPTNLPKQVWALLTDTQ